MSDEAIPSAGIDENILGTLYQLSQRYHSHGLFESASRLLAFLLRHDPMRASFHFALGKALHGETRHGKAALSYRRAVKLGLPDIEVHLYMGQCLIFEGEFADAAVALNQFLSLAQVRGQPQGLAQFEAPTDIRSHQTEQARHLLENIVMPRLQPNDNPGFQPGARTQAPRHQPLEIAR